MESCNLAEARGHVIANRVHLLRRLFNFTRALQPHAARISTCSGIPVAREALVVAENDGIADEFSVARLSRSARAGTRSTAIRLERINCIRRQHRPLMPALAVDDRLRLRAIGDDGVGEVAIVPHDGRRSTPARRRRVSSEVPFDPGFSLAMPPGH